jgi:Ca2+-binding RTX toxin-like protein
VQHVSVALRDDSLAEGNERFGLLLSGLGGGAAAQVILDDDMGSALVGRSDQPAVAAPVLSCADVLATEGDGFAEFTVQLSAPGLGVVSVAYSLVAGSATEGNDYVAGNGTLRFAPGVTTQTVRVELRADSVAEGTETFALRLSSPTGATLGSATATVTLADDDGNTTLLAYGAGDDTYLVTSSRQLVLERAGGGQDLVESSISYTLTDTDGAGDFGGNVENLRLLGSAPISGTGNAQDNTLYAGSGNNVLDGGAGRDTASYADARSAVTLSLALATVQATGGSGRDTLRNFENLSGSRFNDQLSGNDAGNLIDGGAGADTLAGGLGNDTLVGGDGQDRLTGGAGNDVFRFKALADSAAGAATRDTIADFSAGDLVDLRSLDANELLSGDQAFVWIGAAAFSANTPGQLRLAGNVLQASTDADTAAELEIVLSGRSSMAATDFLL